MIDNNRFLYLLEKYVEGKSTSEEHEEFFRLLISNEYDAIVEERIANDYNQETGGKGDIPPHVAQEIIRNILSSDKNVKQVLPKKKPVRFMLKWVAAACFICVLAVGFLWYKQSGDKRVEAFNGIIPATDVVKKNQTAESLKVLLSDGSKVVLAPGSVMHYPASFSGETREVFLEGDAHFDVAHNPERPFLVYSQNIVTKVLGTSFDIVNNKKDGNIEVSVKSGKVQVFENKKSENKTEESENAVILTANQRAIYAPQTRQMTYTLVKNPVRVAIANAVPVQEPPPPQNLGQASHKIAFVYDEAGLDKVFDDIEKNYGIEIELENPAIKNCVFTGDLSNKDLFVLLKIVCLSTNSDYQLNGTKILIKGRGCK